MSTERIPTRYREVSRYLGSKSHRLVTNHSHVRSWSSEGGIALCLHRTDIVAWDADGRPAASSTGRGDFDGSVPTTTYVFADGRVIRANGLVEGVALYREKPRRRHRPRGIEALLGAVFAPTPADTRRREAGLCGADDARAASRCGHRASGH